MRKLLVVVLIALAVAAATAWPRINEVETGRTPEYADLQPHVYKASPAAVEEALRAAVAAIPRLEWKNSGRGPGGTAVQLVASTPLLKFQDDVTVHLKAEGGRTRVSVHSKSRVGQWDFGQNARNIRELLAELDRRLPGR